MNIFASGAFKPDDITCELGGMERRCAECNQFFKPSDEISILFDGFVLPQISRNSYVKLSSDAVYVLHSDADTSCLEDFISRHMDNRVAIQEKNNKFLESLVTQEQPTEQPTEQKQEKPIEKPIEKPTEQKQEKPTEQKQEKPIEQKQEKPIEKPTEQKQEKPIEKPTEQKQEKPIEKPIEKPTEQKQEQKQKPSVVK